MEYEVGKYPNFKPGEKIIYKNWSGTTLSGEVVSVLDNSIVEVKLGYEVHFKYPWELFYEEGAVER